jgi:hypothetical protein
MQSTATFAHFARFFSWASVRRGIVDLSLSATGRSSFCNSLGKKKLGETTVDSICGHQQGLCRTLIEGIPRDSGRSVFVEHASGEADLGQDVQAFWQFRKLFVPTRKGKRPVLKIS